MHKFYKHKIIIQ